MIKELAIENFKGIKSGKLNGLTEVNIFIGRNNSGKSTILEALYFNRAAFEPADVLNNPLLERLLQRRVRRQTTNFEEFFYRYNTENRVISNLLFDSDKRISIESVFYGGNIRFELVIPDTSKKIASILVGRGLDASISDVEWIRARTSESTRHPFNYIMDKITALPENSELKRYFTDNKKEIEFLSKITLIDADIVRNIEEIEIVFWDSIRRKRLDKEIVAMLNTVYETKMEDLALIPYPHMIEHERGERRSLHKLTTAIHNISLNLDGYGEGLRDAFSILLIASQLDNTAILIEEPEVHQYPEALNHLFNHLLKIARKNNLQLFISTHSLDVLGSLARFSSEYGIKVFHTDLNSDGNLKIRTIVAPDLKLLIDLGTDIRFLGELFTYLIIEGKEDRVFLNAVSQKLFNQSLEKLPYEILPISKQEQKKFIKALVSTGKPIKVLTDYNEKRELSDIVRDYANCLQKKYRVEVENNHIAVRETGSHVTITAAGLPKDSDLDSIGINNYAMEDYLLKLLAIDETVEEWAGITIKELRQRADKLRYEKPLNKSKTMLAALGVIKDIPEEILIKEIVEKSDKKVLTDLLRPLTSEIF